MKKKSILFFLSLLCLSSKGQNDSIRTKNKSLWIGIGIGAPIINNFTVANAFDLRDHYKVRSKTKPLFTLSIERHYKKFLIGASTSFIQNEFIGKSFDVEIPNYSKFPPYYSEIYKVHQRIEYNSFHLGLNGGTIFNINSRHKVLLSLELIFNYKYNIRITNYYDKDQYGYDTTIYKLAKNVKSDKLYGYMIPKSALNVKYFYKISNRFALDFTLQIYYSFLTKVSGSSDDYFGVFEKGQFNTTYEYLNVYDELNHFMLSPILSLKYRLK